MAATSELAKEGFRVTLLDALPMTATGKISKKDLRAKFADYKLPG